MRTNIIVIDEFYSNPDTVREFALQQDFSVRGNFPGLRTQSFLTDDVKQTIQRSIQNAGGNVTEWYQEEGLSGSFEIATAQNRTWIHTDHFNNWAGVLYLTPDPPHTGGTGLYRHKKTGNYIRVDKDYEGYDYTKWDLHDVIGNRYNRLAMYRSDIFHASIDYFGDSKENGRLFQLFFFNTEY